jgi:hypothetical protein
MWSRSRALPTTYKAKAPPSKGPVFDWSKAPDWLQSAMKDATYLGRGANSYVWDTKNGYVVKVTKEMNTYSLARHLAVANTPGVARVRAVLENAVYCVGRRMGNETHLYQRRKGGYRVIVQEKCKAMKPQHKVWHQLKALMIQAHEATKHMTAPKSKFSRMWDQDYQTYFNNNGFDAHVQLEEFKLLIEKSGNPQLARCALAVPLLQNYVTFYDAKSRINPFALDIDHFSNWGIDAQGDPIFLDPLT